MTAVPESLVVLLADDDPNDVILIRRAFKRVATPARLFEVRDGEEVVAYLEGRGQFADRSAWPFPRLLVLDQWMPRLSGFEVLCWIRSDPRFALLPAVILTGGLPPSQVDWADKCKAAYCVKFVESKKMVEMLRASIATALRLVWQSTPNPAATWFRANASVYVGLQQRPDISLLSKKPIAPVI